MVNCPTVKLEEITQEEDEELQEGTERTRFRSLAAVEMITDVLVADSKIIMFVCISCTEMVFGFIKKRNGQMLFFSELS